MSDAIAETCEPLDKSVIESLRELSDDGDLIAELFQLFQTDTPPRLDAIDAAIGAADARALHRAAHTLKGSAGGLGATRIQAMCVALEQAGKQGTTEGTAHLAADLRREYARVVRAIEELSM